MNLLLILAILGGQTASPPPCDKPVYMVVSGPTHDRARMQAYAKAIADSGLYQQLGGYYVNVPVPVATFEGDIPPNLATLIVRFPCLANARAFWYSKTYQDSIKPLRLNPSAGDYTVTVYAEVPLRADMVGKVGDAAYKVPFDANGVERVPD
ncbi:MAG: DUF1330 domain-containing protein [Sphingopyxis sp.]|nr:DUF1330 domain-containing protein [Sphingopyxis sp.]